MIHNLLRLWFALLPVILLGGCFGAVSDYFKGEDNAEPPTPLETISNSITVARLWSEGTGKSIESLLSLRPIVQNGRVYIAGSGGVVTALDAESGTTIWVQDTRARIGGGPGVGEGLVLVGTRDGEVIALSATDGKEKWRARVTSEVLSVPSASEGIVVARAIDGRMFGLSADEGDRVWVHDRSVPTLTLRGSSSPVLYRGLVIYGSDSGRLTGLVLKKGFPVWESSIAFPSGRSELDRIVDIDGDPVIKDDIIYVASYQGSIVALDIRNAKPVWKRSFSSYNGMSADGKNLYITDDLGNVSALDRRTGATLWKQEKLLHRKVTAPAVIGEHVVVGDFEGYVHWLSVDDGRFVARDKVGGSGISSMPISDGKRVYVFGNDGTLSALQAR